MTSYSVENDDTIFNFLRNNVKGKSKNNIKTLLKNGSIRVNDVTVTKYDTPVKVNDIVSIGVNKKINDITLNIIYEDDNIIVIDKPTKILSISNKNEKEITLYHTVSDYLKKNHQKVFVIHRLDYDTSGVMMFAKNEKVQELYQRDWNNLAKEREYTAIVEGKTNSSGHIESYLKQTKTLFVYSSKNKDGLFAVTDYKRITSNDKYSLLKIYISTGRRNQIRCHMHDIAHPIIGDNRYESKSNPLNRLGLHASKLIIQNPKTKEIMTFTSPVPNEFLTLFENK